MRQLAQVLKEGKVAVIRTDTLYGIVGLAHNPSVVRRIYEIKNRDETKPAIVLIADFHDLKRFPVRFTDPLLRILEKHWPGRVSIIVPVEDERGEHFHLHRGTRGIAFRIPADEELRELLRTTGPLIAPSANPEGLPPAKNVREAMRYFGTAVHYYHDGGTCEETKPSKIIRITETYEVEVIRE